MSCNNCNKNNCSCGTTPLRYNGPAIECLGIDCNLTYDDALARLAEYMCDRALEKGDKGDQGDTGETGADSLVPGTTGDPGTNGINGSNGTNGTNGTNGLNGNGILEIAWTSNSAGQPVTTQGTVDTYTVTYTNATTDTFEIRNGIDGTNGVNGVDGVDGVDGVNGVNGVDGVNGTDGISLNWLGSLAVAPVSPNLNDAYYDTVLFTSYVWDGLAWQIVAIDGVDGADGAPGPPGPGAGAPVMVSVELQGSGSFEVPAGVTQLDVDIWGGGAAASTTRTSVEIILAAGGGGAYERVLVAVAPGQFIPYTVGNGGSTTVVSGVNYQGTDGETTDFGGQLAPGGEAAVITQGNPNIVTYPKGGVATGGNLNISGGGGQVVLLPFVGPAFDYYQIGSANGGGTGLGHGNQMYSPRNETTVVAGSTSPIIGGGGGALYAHDNAGAPIFNQAPGFVGKIIVRYFL